MKSKTMTAKKRKFYREQLLITLDQLESLDWSKYPHTENDLSSMVEMIRRYANDGRVSDDLRDAAERFMHVGADLFNLACDRYSAIYDVGKSFGFAE